MVNKTSILPFNKIQFVNETEQHYIYKCCFCGDSQKHSNHGHLYISKTSPVFFCHRCNKSGHISELIEYLHEPCHIQYSSTIEYDLPNLNISDILSKMNKVIEGLSIYITDYEKEYFKRRTKLKNITIDNIIKYSLFPDLCARKLLYDKIFKKLNNDPYRTWTIRGLGSYLSGRTLDSNNTSIRYINGDIHMPWDRFLTIDSYFIRSSVIKKFNQNIAPKNLIVAEGVYDIVNLFLRRNKYFIEENNSFFVAVQCSNYIRAFKLYNMMWNNIPENIIVFADRGITLNELKNQFNNIKNNNNRINIKFNWPKIKDWEECGPIDYFYNF